MFAFFVLTAIYGSLILISFFFLQNVCETVKHFVYRMRRTGTDRKGKAPSKNAKMNVLDRGMGEKNSKHTYNVPRRGHFTKNQSFCGHTHTTQPFLSKRYLGNQDQTKLCGLIIPRLVLLALMLISGPI